MPKDALDSKYGRAQAQGSGFEIEHLYRDGRTNISLTRNTFGFDSDQRTSLIYQWTPFVGEVNKMKAAIEDDKKKECKEGRRGSMIPARDQKPENPPKTIQCALLFP